MSWKNSGAFSATVSGRRACVPAPWEGYHIGWQGSSTGIDIAHTYSPDFGLASFYILGKLIRLEEHGRFLRVQDGRFNLGTERVVVVVDNEGHANLIGEQQAGDVEASLDEWFGTFDITSARALPPPVSERVVDEEEDNADRGMQRTD